MNCVFTSHTGECCHFLWNISNNRNNENGDNDNDENSNNNDNNNNSKNLTKTKQILPYSVPNITKREKKNTGSIVA